MSCSKDLTRSRLVLVAGTWVTIVRRGWATGRRPRAVAGEHVTVERWRVGRRQSRKFTKVQVLVVGQQQCPGQRIDDLAGGGDVPPLLQPGVPGDPNTRKLRDFLPAQSWGPAPAGGAAVWQPDFGGRQLGPAGTQERTKLGASGWLSSQVATGHAAVLAAGCLCRRA